MGPQRVRRDGATKYSVAQHSTAAYLLLNRKASQRPRTNWPPFHIREFWGQERFLEKSHFLWDTSIYLSAACKELEELYDPDEPGKPPSGVDTGGGRTWRQDPNLSASALLVCMCVPTHMHTRKAEAERLGSCLHVPPSPPVSTPLGGLPGSSGSYSSSSSLQAADR